MKPGFLLPDLEETVANFLHRTFLPWKFLGEYHFTAKSAPVPLKSIRGFIIWTAPTGQLHYVHRSFWLERDGAGCHLFCMPGWLFTTPFCTLSPSCTGWGERIWRQIPDKILMYWFLKETYSCRNVFKTFWTYDVTSKDDVLTSILLYFFFNPAMVTSCPPPPTQLQTTRGPEKSRQVWFAVQHGTCPDSNQLRVPGSLECGG